MSASDVSPFASLATPDPSPAPTETSVATEETVPESENTEVTSESPETTAEVTGEDAVPGTGDDRPVDARTNPAAIRNALKWMRDTNPELASVARQLNNEFGRAQAYKAAFPKVSDAQNARALLDAVGGDEGFASLQETVKSVQATDAKLYSSNPAQQGEALADLYDDMKSEGKQEAFGRLATPYLDQLRQVDEKAYFAAMKPHFYQGLRDVGLQNVLSSINQHLTGEQPDINGAKQVLANIDKWFEDLKAGVDTASKANLDPERQAFAKERADFHTQKQQEFQRDCATGCDTHNNNSLLNALKPFTKLPAFKNWSRESWVDLGNGLKQQLLTELTADKTYQAQMDAFFAQKSPDKGKITAFHQQKVDSMSARIVKDLLNRRYPGYNKSGAVAAKPKAAAPINQQTADGKAKPTYVSSKPDWNDINWEMDPTQKHYITGRAVLKSGKFVSWSSKDKR